MGGCSVTHPLRLGTPLCCAVLVASLQAQLRQSQANQKLVTFCHFNADQCVDATRPVAVAWLPGTKGEAFLAAHSSGNVYVYQKARRFTV